MEQIQKTDTTLLDALLIPAWIYCPDTLRILYVNEAAVKAYGYSRKEFAGMTLEELRPAEDVPQLLSEISQQVRPDITRPATSRWRHRRKDGTLFHVEMFASYIEYDGRPARMVQAIDVDSRVKEQQESDLINKMLQEQKDDLEYVLGAINEVVWVSYADDMQLLYTNDACQRVYGYTAAEMIADKNIFINAIHPDDREDFYEATATMHRTGTVETEFRIIHRDGGIRYVRGTAHLRHPGSNGRSICCGLTIDITALKKEQHRTYNILNSITDGFFVLDREWKFTYINKAYQNMFGNSVETLEGRTYWEVFPQAAHQQFYTQYHRAVAENTAVHFEEYATSLQRWVKVSAYPMGDGLAVYFTDINEERLLHDALIRQDQNLNALINNTDSLIWSIDTDMNLLSVNRACQEYVHGLTGRWVRPGEPTAAHYFPGEMKDRWLNNYRRAFAGDTFKAIEQYETPDGELQTWEASFYQIRDSHGNITGVSCFCTNITHMRNQLMRIELQNARLREIAQMQSHQVRGPVATIMGLQQLFNTQNPADPINTEVLEGIQTACIALDNMIRNIDRNTRC